MKCKECPHYLDRGYDGEKFCNVTKVINPRKPLPDCDRIDDMLICFNCKHWHGGGDWGLTCDKHYHFASTDGFHRVCEDFEKKD